MEKLTIVILTKNEEKNILEVINNVKVLSNSILVIDSGSSDSTVELAKGMGVKVIHRDLNNDFSQQRNFALEYVDTEWVLYIDADERMDADLINNIRSAIAAPKKAMYRFLRRNNAFGREFKYGVLSPDYVIRLFPKGEVNWEEMVHERPNSSLPVITIRGCLKHFTYRDFSEYLFKMELYSTIAAKNNFSKGKKVYFLKDLVVRPLFAFLKMYVLKKGFLEGWLGFVLCINYANYTLNKYVKLKLVNEDSQNAMIE